jgi:hypothetical protein
MKLIRLSITLILLLFVSLAVKAGGDGSSNYYKVTANASPTGRGLVYGSADTKHGPWLFKESVSSRFYGGSSSSISGKIYLYASPYEGYALEKWTDANGNIVTSGNNVTFDASSTTITSPTANTFTAHFVDTYVSVFSANNDLCAVSIDNPINTSGQIVHLTATPKSGATFLGWRVKGTATILSTQQSNYEVTATSTKTTYEAVFSYVGNQQSFVRLQSLSETSKYMSLVQDKFSYTAVMQAAGGYSNITSAEGKANALNKAGEYLSEDFSLSESVYDPGQVILHDATNQNFYAQGTDVGYITDGYSCHHGGNTSAGDYVGAAKLKIDAQKTNYSTSYKRISMNPSVNLENTGVASGTQSLGTIYLINDNGSISVTQTEGSTSEYQWEKKTLDGTSQYFAFYPDLYDTRTGKYYTSLRTSFSYKIKNTDKVKAYEINEIPADGAAIMTPFEDGEIIPGNLSVVLESTSQEPTDNILLPYDLEYTKANTVLYGKYGHRLHCYTGATNSGDQFDECTEDGIGYFNVAYKGSSDIYKLDVNSDGEVGFWTKVTTNEIISGNKAYSPVQCALFVIEEPGTPLAEILANGVNGTEYTVSDDLAVVDYADVANYAFVTDGNGNWIKVAADDAVFNEIINKQVIKGKTLVGTLSDIELNPVLTVTVAPEAGSTTVANTIEQLDLTSDFAPKVNQVVDVTGWWNAADGALRAYEPNNSVQGKSLTVDYTWGATSNTLENGKRYQVRCAINIKEAWHAGTNGIAPKDYDYDFQNYIGYALRMPDAPTAISTLDVDNASDVVNVYNMQGMLLKRGVNINEATIGLSRGIYIVGNKKVVVK